MVGNSFSVKEVNESCRGRVPVSPADSPKMQAYMLLHRNDMLIVAVRVRMALLCILNEAEALLYVESAGLDPFTHNKV